MRVPRDLQRGARAAAPVAASGVCMAETCVVCVCVCVCVCVYVCVCFGEQDVHDLLAVEPHAVKLELKESADKVGLS